MKKMQIFIAVLLLLSSLSLIIIVQPVGAPGATWSPELVDGNTDVGEYNSLVLNSTGIPHIAYRRCKPFPSAVLHAYKIGAAWYNETVFTFAGGVGEYISLAIDSMDVLHISFLANAELYYSTNASGTWTETVVDEDAAAIVGWYTSIAVDTSNNPRIAYYDKSNDRLKYAYYDGSSWNIGDIADSHASDDAGQYCSLALASDDTPHISYFYEAAPFVGKLKHAWKTGGTWYTEVVTDEDSPGQYTSMAIDSSDGLHISHYNRTGKDLMYSYNCSGTGWTWTTLAVETTGDVGFCTSMALDSAGEPHIAYYNETNSEIQRTWRELGSWYTETVVSTGTLSTAGSISIAMASDNQPRISYYNASSGNLMYASGFVDFIDLKVDEVWVVPPGALENGTLAQVKANITNQGTQAAGAFIVRFYDGDPANGGTQIGMDQNVPSLQSKKYSIVNVPWTAIPIGIHKIYAEVNPNNAIFDPFQLNDKLNTAVEVIGPDLEIGAGNVTVTPTPPLQEGDTITITANVANIGPSNATNIRVRFYIGDPGAGGTPIGTDQIITSLNVSKSKKVSVKWTAGPMGNQILFAVADPNKIIMEMNETNNQANITAFVSRSDLAVTAGDLRVMGGGTPKEGIQVSVEVDVHNVGDVNASGVEVELYQGDPDLGGTLVDGPKTLALVVVDELSTASFNWTPSTPGSYKLYTVIDPHDTILELIETNNTANITVDVIGTPTAPLNLQAAAGDAYVNLTWTIPDSDGCTAITNYMIYRSDLPAPETLKTEIGPVLYLNDTDVVNGVTYYYRVKAKNIVGEGPFSNEVNATPRTVPSAPQNLQVKAAGDSFVSLTWTVPASDGGAQISNYRLYRGAASGAETLLTELAIVLNYNDTSVINGVTYFYKVRAKNIVGEGQFSNEVSGIPKAVPSAPQNLYISSASEFYVNLAWVPPISNGGFSITNYRIYRCVTSNAEEFLTEVGPVLFYNDTSITKGVIYYYKVSAKNIVGEGPLSIEASTAFPSAPLNLQAGAGDAFVDLTWESPISYGLSPITNYTIYRGTTIGQETLLTVIEPILYFNDTNVINGITYYYKVRAKNIAGEGPFSNGVNATPKGVPSAPQNLQITAATESYINLTWTVPAFDGGPPITNYRVYRGIESESETFLIEIDPVLYYNDTDIEKGVIYYYKVSAKNIVGEGPLSIEASTAFPSAPLNLEAIAGDAFVDLIWDAPGSYGLSPITHYTIYRGTTSGLETLLTELGCVLCYQDTNVINGVTYYYKVRAKNAIGKGPFSNEATATPRTVPSAPLNLEAVAGDSYVNLTWNPPESDSGSPITSYIIYRSIKPGEETFLVEIGNVLTYTDQDLTNGMIYYYKVSASNGIGEGPKSNEVSATPETTISVTPEKTKEEAKYSWWLVVIFIIIIVIIIALIIIFIYTRRSKKQKKEPSKEKEETTQEPEEQELEE